MIVVVGPVRLVACSCGSCNREDLGVGVGRGVAVVGPDMSLLATVAGAETLDIYINISRPPMSLNCVWGLNHKYPQRLHLLHQGDPLSGPKELHYCRNYK